MRCVVHQITTVKVGDDPHAGGQLMSIELGNLLVQRVQGSVCFRALAQKDDALDDIVIMDYGSVFMANSLTELSQPHLGRLHHYRQVADANRWAVTALQDGGRYVVL